ncbi:MAG: polyribonucleotide nucleotidyltransferase [Minisyncoccus archaeiphilus]|jgi:polyribonucleotide nucleotidyltransferase|uniref:polyribonucleotide nucleotidyltransferase n=1 Tax=Minisyncoccus archaeiphilus TaxID=3238481 RepID=UPI002B0E47AC|nr:MAG: polyribonucleotide nucleotidyltransferase [Candidatus Parcubacteria bacterium]
MKIESFQLKLDDNKTIEVEFRDLAERANGSVFVKYGDTCVMANCAMSKKEIEGLDFFPLTTLYEEKFYAIGKIFGSRFQRREGRPTEQCILNSRLIDRAIRPLFPAGLNREVQVIVTCLSWDKTIDPAILGLFAASLVLSTSDIPWNGPLAPIKFGEKEGNIIIFPLVEEREDSKLEMTISFLKSESGKEILVNMIEAGMKEVTEEKAADIIFSGKDFAKKMLDFQEEIASKIGKEKIILKEKFADEEVRQDISNFLEGKLEDAIFGTSSLEQLKEEFSEHIKKFEDDEKIRFAKHLLEDMTEEVMHQGAIKKDIRIDGRNSKQLRNIECDAGILKRIHGTGIFCRGQTKVMSFLTLGAPGDQKLMEEMELQGKKRFMHHYNFPPYSVGETGPIRGPGRREIGHGMLGEKALRYVLPNVEVFPYTIRIVSEVLCSNGSSSMASTCGACLAMMDGGIPITNPVSGIAMGLMLEMDKQKSTEDKEYCIITDVQGEEDHFGDMDFKVAGTKNGVTAIQMDIKVRGITEKITREALAQARIARLEILEKMLAIIPEPRKDISPYAPRIYILKINPEKIGEVIGPGGKVINEIIDACNVTIDIEDSGEVYITSDKKESAERAIEWIKNITHEVQVGEIFQSAIVKRILDFGAFVEFLPGQEGMVHISQLDEKRVAKVTDVLKIGDTIPVKVIAIDEQGRINLSLKQAKK